MTLLQDAPAKAKAVVAADPQPDVTLSAKEQDAIVTAAAAEEKPATVPGDIDGARRAWGQPTPTRQFTRD